MALYLLLPLLAAVAPAVAQFATTTSASDVTSLFVMDPPSATESLSISASIIRVVPSLSQTEYWIKCALPSQDAAHFGQPLDAPCNYIDGASVTINPTAMMLTVHQRVSQIVDGRQTGGQPSVTKETFVTVHATASCQIDGTKSASCTGQMTSTPTVLTHSGTSTWGTASTTVTETISTVFADVTAHSVPVSITAGLENLLASTTTSSVTTSRSSGSGARPTGQAQAAVLAGVAALVGGGVALA